MKPRDADAANLPETGLPVRRSSSSTSRSSSSKQAISKDDILRDAVRELACPLN